MDTVEPGEEKIQRVLTCEKSQSITSFTDFTCEIYFGYSEHENRVITM